MNLNSLYKTVAVCLDNMPETYPKPAVIVHESSIQLVNYRGDTRHSYMVNNGYPASLVAGMAEAEKNVIHLCYDYLATATEDDILELILHEIGHLVLASKYGINSEEYLDEKKADSFARRWMKKIKPLLA